MDRTTRKANFKKLQLPAGTKLRTTRSGKASDPSLSKYFNTSNQAEPETKQADLTDKIPERSPKHTNLAAFIYNKTQNVINSSKEKINQPRESDLFEKVTKKIKKAPIQPSTVKKRKTRNKLGRQQTIKSAFLQNEQLFAEITAQHCIADNFNPTDIQLAIAISKSEVEVEGINADDAKPEDILDLQQEDSLRNKLQKYGFRTGSKENYNGFLNAFLPGMKCAKKTKWANKFTALTLRNAEFQAKKLNANIEAFLKQQINTNYLSAEASLMKPFNITNTNLARLVAKRNEKIITNEEERLSVSDFYVHDLFEVSTVPAGHLLKNWKTIQGRDLSPKPLKTKNQKNVNKLAQIYEELEKMFNTKEKENTHEEESIPVSNQEIHEEECLNVTQSQKVATKSTEERNEDLDRLVELLEDKGEKNACNSQTSDVMDSNVKLSSNLLSSPPKKRTKIGNETCAIKSQTLREASPDIFANSDSEDEKMIQMNEKDNENVHNITTYEIYTSDEVKTAFTYAKLNADNCFIDLTVDSSDSSKTSNTQPPNLIMINDEEIDDCILDTQMRQSVLKLSCEDFSADFKINDPVKQLSGNNLSAAHNVVDCLDLYAKYGVELPQSQYYSEKQIIEANGSIDLTQESNIDGGDDHDECDNGVLLSDDEINYSIWKADKKLNQTKSCKSLNKTESSDSSEESLSDSVNSLPLNIDLTLQCYSTDICSNSSSRSPNKSALSRERAEFGIMDAALSEPLLPAEIELVPPEEINWAEASFIETENFSKLKRFSCSSAEKFKEFLDITVDDKLNLSSTSKNLKLESGKCLTHQKNDGSSLTQDTSLFDDLDELDRLVNDAFGKTNAKVQAVTKVPNGFEKLLNGEISMEMPKKQTPQKIQRSERNLIGSEQKSFDENSIPKSVEINDNIYNICICHDPKPNYMLYSEAQLLKELYNYGIRPLKRPQAIKMLEYIYNQTHPVLRSKENHSKPEAQVLSKSKSTTECTKTVSAKISSMKYSSQQDVVYKKQLKTLPANKSNTEKLAIELCDGLIHQKHNCVEELPIELPGEKYILQTNVTKKTSQPLLPLHIAWHNLLCANPLLHESVLMFEPIDLHAIYVFFKTLGYRYDPKDMKCFFDQRCIIFRYELLGPGGQSKSNTRHMRKLLPTQKRKN